MPIDPLMARARGATNPFRVDRIDSAWEGEFTDVPAINAAAFQQCCETIEDVRATGQSRGLLMTGQPGSGKSHLLRRLRHAIGDDGRDCFVYVPPVAAAGRLYGELLRRVVTDMIREPGEGAASQLETLFIRELLSGPIRSRVTPLQLWADLRRRTPAGPALFEALEPAMNRLTLSLQLEPDVTLVLRHYLAEHYRADAYRWLTGCSVPEAVAARLGVNLTLEAESDARLALFTLSKLTGRASVLVLAFDQLEGLQVRPDDLDGVRAFGSAVADLLINCRNVAAISCVQAYFRADLAHALPPAHMARIEQDAGIIQLLDVPTAEALVAARLGGDADLAAARSAARGDNLWPLGGHLAAALPLTHGLVPARAVLNAARVLFEAWRTADVGGVAVDEPSPNDLLAATFADREQQALAQPADEGTLADGLLKLLDLRRPGQVQRSTARGLDVVIGPAGQATGVSVCHAMNMTSLAARLRQVTEAVEHGTVRRAIVVRDERLRISPTAIATQNRIQWLKERGHVLLRPTAAAYAAIAAARALLAESAAGDLAAGGRTIDTDDVRRWLLEARPVNAFELLDEIDHPVSDVDDAVLEALREALDGVWIAPIEAVAQRIDRPAADLAAHLKNHQMVGLISGPPALVYLKPDGLVRE
jgi:hypothetical protein